jgi:protein TonB
MISAAEQPVRPEPLSSGARYRIATASSVGFHLIVLILVCLLAARAPARTEVLIPVELTISGQQAEQLELGGGRPDAPVTQTVVSTAPRPSRKPASSPGGRAKAAPAPPRVLTSKKGTEPSGPTGAGRDRTGSGGASDAPSGPTKGPGIAGGPAPVYPKDALDGGLEGRVSLTVTIAADGSVSGVSVAKSSGHTILDDAAVRAVKRDWVFQPALKNGKPVAGAVTVVFEFSSGKVQAG